MIAFLIEVQHAGDVVQLSPHRVSGAMLCSLKRMTEKDLEKPVADCVLSVPTYFTEERRRALLMLHPLHI